MEEICTFLSQYVEPSICRITPEHHDIFQYTDCNVTTYLLGKNSDKSRSLNSNQTKKKEMKIADSDSKFCAVVTFSKIDRYNKKKQTHKKINRANVQ